MEPVEVDDEGFADSPRAGDLESEQGFQRRIGGLEQAEFRDIGAFDEVADESWAQEFHERVDLGQFRHDSSMRFEADTTTGSAGLRPLEIP